MEVKFENIVFIHHVFKFDFSIVFHNVIKHTTSRPIPIVFVSDCQFYERCTHSWGIACQIKCLI